jgi:hypothetical protein
MRPPAGSTSGAVQKNSVRGTHLSKSLDFQLQAQGNKHVETAAASPVSRRPDFECLHPSPSPHNVTSSAIREFRTSRNTNPLHPEYKLASDMSKDKRPNYTLTDQYGNESKDGTWRMREFPTLTHTRQIRAESAPPWASFYDSLDTADIMGTRQRSIMASRQERDVLKVSDIPGATRREKLPTRISGSLSTQDIPGASPTRRNVIASGGEGIKRGGIDTMPPIPGSSPGNHRYKEHPQAYASTYAAGCYPQPSPPNWYFSRVNRKPAVTMPLSSVVC